ALVEDLHLVLLERHTLDLVLGAEPVLGLRAAAQVAELGLNHAPPVAGRHMDDVHHAPEVVLVLDGHADAELRGGNQHREGILLSFQRTTRPTKSQREATSSAVLTTAWAPRRPGGRAARDRD